MCWKDYEMDSAGYVSRAGARSRVADVRDLLHTNIVDYGDVPTWLAFIAAVGAALYARAALRSERRRDHESQQASRRAQAELVCAWIENDGIPERPIVTLRNESGLPIRNVAVHVTPRDDGSDHFGTELRVRSLVAPRRDAAYELYAEHPVGQRPVAIDLDCSLVFTDAAGAIWCRNTQGTLVPEPVRAALPPALPA